MRILRMWVARYEPGVLRTPAKPSLRDGARPLHGARTPYASTPVLLPTAVPRARPETFS